MGLPTRPSTPCRSPPHRLIPRELVPRPFTPLPLIPRPHTLLLSTSRRSIPRRIHLSPLRQLRPMVRAGPRRIWRPILIRYSPLTQRLWIELPKRRRYPLLSPLKRRRRTLPLTARQPLPLSRGRSQAKAPRLPLLTSPRSHKPSRDRRKSGPCRRVTLSATRPIPLSTATRVTAQRINLLIMLVTAPYLLLRT